MKTIATLLSLLFASSNIAQTWSSALEVPDHRGNGGFIGLWNSMTIVNGNPAIGFSTTESAPELYLLRSELGASTRVVVH